MRLMHLISFRRRCITFDNTCSFIDGFKVKVENASKFLRVFFYFWASKKEKKGEVEI